MEGSDQNHVIASPAQFGFVSKGAAVNVLSLFDGMSCGQIALQRAGIKVDNYFASEINKYSVKVTMSNYPDTKQIGDVCSVSASMLPKINLLIGGSPCQDLRPGADGLKGKRSKLFYEYYRLFKECNPDYFLLENVSKISNDDKKIITDLLGVESILINSNLVSAQNRKRYYWTNIKNITQPEDKNIYLKDILLPIVDIKYLLSEKAFFRGCFKNYSSPKIYPNKTGTLNTKNNSGQMSIDSGTTFIPVDVDDKALTLTASYEHNANSAEYYKQRRKQLIKIENINPSKKGQNGNVYSDEGLSPTLTTNKGEGIKILQDNQWLRRLTPVECERLQTVGDNYTSCVSDSQRYQMLGNGWTIDVITHILKCGLGVLAAAPFDTNANWQ